MSEFKGTPGPWKIYDGHVYGPGSRVEPLELDGETKPYRTNLVALVYNGEMLSGCREANTIALAQVPAMVEALLALGAEYQDLMIHKNGEFAPGPALDDLLGIIRGKVTPVLKELHAGGAL